MKMMKIITTVEDVKSLFGLKHVHFSMLSEEKALKYHSQSLDRLNERGGMGVKEILYNVGAIDLPELNSSLSQEMYGRLLRYHCAFWSRGNTIDDMHHKMDIQIDRIAALTRGLRNVHAELAYHNKDYNQESPLYNEVMIMINEQKI